MHINYKVEDMGREVPVWSQVPAQIQGQKCSNKFFNKQQRWSSIRHQDGTITIINPEDLKNQGNKLRQKSFS